MTVSLALKQQSAVRLLDGPRQRSTKDCGEKAEPVSFSSRVLFAVHALKVFCLM